MERDSQVAVRRMLKRKSGLAAPTYNLRELSWAVIIAMTCALIAMVWAIRVPIFEFPDEIAHGDYAFALYSAGRPFVLKDARPKNFATEQSRYIAEATHYREMRYNPVARVPAGYGTRSFYRRLDQAAPRPLHTTPHDGSDMPYVMFAYPVAYYAIVATVMVFVGDISSQSLSAVFFAGRFLSSLCLLLTCLTTWRLFRLTGFDSRTALLATFGVGAFPLVTTISAAIQPDTLALLMSTIVLYRAIVFKRYPTERHAVILSVACAAMFFSKQHNALAFWLPSAFLVTVMWWRQMRRTRALALLCVGLLPLTALVTSLSLSPVSQLRDPQRFVLGALHGANASHGSGLVDTIGMLLSGAVDLYGGGAGFWSFWLHFGIRGATYVPIEMAVPLAKLLLIGTILTGSAVIVVQTHVLRRIWTIGRCRSRHSAITLILRDIAMNAYAFVLTILLLLYLGSGIALQGRYMAVALVPLVIILLRTIPRLFKCRRRTSIRLLLASTMAIYSFAFSLCGIRAIENDYYAPAPHPLIKDVLADVDTVTIRQQSFRAGDEIRVLPNEAVTFNGHAVDMRTGLPAKHIVVRVNGRHLTLSGTGVESPDVAAAFIDDGLRRSGFRISLPGSAFHAGRNLVDFTIEGSTYHHELAFSRPFVVSVR